MIRLEDHVIYSEQLQTDVIPFSIVKQYLEESFDKTETQLDSISDQLTDAMDDLNNAFKEITKNVEDSTRIS